MLSAEPTPGSCPKERGPVAPAGGIDADRAPHVGAPHHREDADRMHSAQSGQEPSGNNEGVGGNHRQDVLDSRTGRQQTIRQQGRQVRQQRECALHPGG